MTYRRLEIAALVVVAVLHGMLLPRLSLGPFSPLAALVGLALADLLTGTVHWFGDTIGRESWPWIGTHFVRPFREHHADPLDITRHDFVERNGNNAIVTIVPLVAVFLLSGHLALGAQVALLAILATNQLHHWAHVQDAPRMVRALQRLRLILPPSEHQRHHSGAFDRAYGVTNGWANPLLDRIVR